MCHSVSHAHLRLGFSAVLDRFRFATCPGPTFIVRHQVGADLFRLISTAV